MSSSFLDLDPGQLHIKIKTCFSEKWAIFNQLLYVNRYKTMKIYKNDVGIMTKMFDMSVYGKNPLKYSSLEAVDRFFLHF